VGATNNIMLSADWAEGTTTIDNAAKAPHSVDVANFLNTCGADIRGAGTDMIKINGVQSLHGCSYAIIPDMIEAGPFMACAAVAGGEVRVQNVIPKHLESITAKMREMNVQIEECDDSLIVRSDGKLAPTSLKTLPYPGFPTDMHPQMSVLMCCADGISYVREGVFDNRFRYVEELSRMGARIKVDGKTAIVQGGTPLSGARVSSVDLRAGAALIVAALVAEGKTEITEINRIERGYDNIVGKLKDLGADIRKTYAPDDDSMDIAN
ncbi:MAG: UDP-N-acetylglucosamine 1-carboxyvinyltransferase, partial [Clostridia bacterium]|nr:UDP-N-acetylglucosamine 1-carboxyvinyltransferase [Clostridia bacterium]